MELLNISAESAIHGQAQDLDESRFQRLFTGRSNPGAMPQAYNEIAPPGAKTDAATSCPFQSADMSA
jgi:hypothetical protein